MTKSNGVRGSEIKGIAVFEKRAIQSWKRRFLKKRIRLYVNYCC